MTYTETDIIVEQKNPFILLTLINKNQLIKRKYSGYTRTEAIEMFFNEINNNLPNNLENDLCLHK